MKVQRRLTSFDGTRIAYRVWGEETERTPVLFCSGIGCNDVYWTEIAPALSEERRVVTWDYPYHGDSGPPGEESEITVGSLARHAHAIVEETSLSPPAVGGHSMGVQVAFEFYRLFPRETAALLPIAGPFQRTVGSLYGTGVGSLILTLLSAATRTSPEATAVAWRVLLDPRLADPIGRVGGLIGHTPKPVMEEYFRHIAGVDLPGLLEMFRLGQEHSARDLLPHIEVPVLIVHGTADVMTPFYLAEEMARRIPDAELVAVPGGAHTLPAEDPDRITAVVQTFLRGRIDNV